MLTPAFVTMPVSASFTEADDSTSITPDTIEVIIDETPIAPQPSTVVRYIPIKGMDTYVYGGNGNKPDVPWWAKKAAKIMADDYNHDKTRDKRVDLSFAVIPTYRSEASFGIAANMSGLYRIEMNDSLCEPSMFHISAKASLKGFFSLKTRGHIFFPDNRSRIIYQLEAYRRKLDFWGISIHENQSIPKSRYIRNSVDFHIEYRYRILSHWFAGIPVQLNYTNGRKFSNPDYIMGENRQYFVTGLGLSLLFDSRDNTYSPASGWYISYTPMIFPGALSNAGSTFWSNRLIVDTYFNLWKGAVCAIDLFGKLDSKGTPWTMLEMIAEDGVRMRGYYMGSYTDNNLLSLQTEIRQHLWSRFSVAAWLGTGTIFPKGQNRWNAPLWLPNGGFGLRIKLKHSITARLDIGFGRHSKGVIFAIGEAF